MKIQIYTPIKTPFTTYSTISSGDPVPGAAVGAAGLLDDPALAELGAGHLHHGVPLAPADGATRRGKGHQKCHWILN